MLMIRIARAVRGVSLALWLGGGVMTFIAAIYVFRIAGNKLGGDIMAPILHVGGVMKLVLAALALLTHGILRGDPASGRSGFTHRTGFVTLALATVIVLVAMVHLEPTMVSLREQFVNDPNQASNPAYAEFRKLHGISMGLATLEQILIAVTLICVVI